MHRVVVFAFVLTMALSSTAAADAISSTDLFEGASVTAHTGTIGGSNVNDMFGATYGSVEGGGKAIFKDGYGSSYVHAVNFETRSSVTLRSFQFVAAHDNGKTQRAIDTFKLLGWNTTTSSYDVLFSMTFGWPYGNSSEPTSYVDASLSSNNNLHLHVNLEEAYVGQKFRVEMGNRV